MQFLNFTFLSKTLAKYKIPKWTQSPVCGYKFQHPMTRDNKT